MSGRRLVLAAMFCCASLASAQNFNVDFDGPALGPNSGGGVPANTFGGARLQGGFWNGLTGAASGAPLVDHLGTPTTARLTVSPPIPMYGFNHPCTIPNDFSLLMEDGIDIWFWGAAGGTVRVSGLMAGQYQVCVYGKDPAVQGPMHVSVNGSPPLTTAGTAPLCPGFILGDDYQLFNVTLAPCEDLVIQATGLVMNGLQITGAGLAIPPTTTDWVGPSGASFTVPANWTAGAPNNNNARLINTNPGNNTSVLSSSVVALCSLLLQGNPGGDQILDVSSSIINSGGAVNVALDGLLRLNNLSTVAASTVTNAGLIESNGVATIVSRVNNATSGQVRVNFGSTMVVLCGASSGCVTGGTVTVNGFCLGCLQTGDTVLEMTGSLALGPADTLNVIDGSLRMGGDFTLAIDDPSRFDFVSGALQLNGPASTIQKLEVLAQDTGALVDLAEADQWPIAILRVGPNATVVRLDDLYDNSPGAAQEALYVGNLILDPGVTLDLNGHRLYYAAVTPANPLSPQSGVTVMDSAGGGGLLAIQPVDDCPTDLNDSGHVGLPDLGIMLTAFGLTGAGDVDGDLDTDLADLGALLADFDSACPN